MYYQLCKLQEQVKEISGIIKQSKTSGTFILSDDFPVQFPLKTEEELQILENYLTTTPSNANTLV